MLSMKRTSILHLPEQHSIATDKYSVLCWWCSIEVASKCLRIFFEDIITSVYDFKHFSIVSICWTVRNENVGPFVFRTFRNLIYLLQCSINANWCFLNLFRKFCFIDILWLVNIVPPRPTSCFITWGSQFRVAGSFSSFSNESNLSVWSLLQW